MKFKFLIGVSIVIICSSFSLTTIAYDINPLISQIHIQSPFITFFLKIDTVMKNSNHVIPYELTAKIGNKTHSLRKVTETEGVAYLLILSPSLTLTDAQFNTLKNYLSNLIAKKRPQDQVMVVDMGFLAAGKAQWISNPQQVRDYLQKLKLSNDSVDFHQSIIQGMNLMRGVAEQIPMRRVIVTLFDIHNQQFFDHSKTQLYEQSASYFASLYFIDLSNQSERGQDQSTDVSGNILDVIWYLESIGGEYFHSFAADLVEKMQQIQSSVNNLFTGQFPLEDFQSPGWKSGGFIDVSIKFPQLQIVTLENNFLIPFTPVFEETSLDQVQGSNQERALWADSHTIYSIAIACVIAILGGFLVCIFKLRKNLKSPGSLHVIPGNAQSIGKREDQQDAFGFSDIADQRLVADGGILAVLADGMGGLECGAEASNLAVQTFLQNHAVKQEDEPFTTALERIIVDANEAVYNLGVDRNLEKQVGSTVASVIVHKGLLYWISAGDSRIYLYRDGKVKQLTEDHVYLEEASRPLTSFLGVPSLTEYSKNQEPLALMAGDRILLCSDGLHGTLSEEEIAIELAHNPQQAADLLVKKALAKNKRYQDNLTVVILALRTRRMQKN